MQLAPIILFVYNRPEHAKLVIESLQRNLLFAKSKLIIFSDGPKNEQDNIGVEAVRCYLSTIRSTGCIEIIERSANLGLSESIIDGVSYVLESFDRAIILEDDLIVSQYFLDYMNDALDYYKDNERVCSIHGYFPTTSSNLPENFFLRGSDCWGWGTWKRSWKDFNKDASALLGQLIESDLVYEFNLEGSYDYMNMLKMQIEGKINSWAIRWHASTFLKSKLTLYPGKSLVENIGFDGSGVHCELSNDYSGSASLVPIKIKSIRIEESKIARDALIRFYLQKRKLTFKKILGKLSKRITR